MLIPENKVKKTKLKKLKTQESGENDGKEKDKKRDNSCNKNYGEVCNNGQRNEAGSKEHAKEKWPGGDL